MKILITGVNGFLGSHLVRNLLQDYDIIGIKGESVKKDYNCSEFKVYEAFELEKIKENPDVVVLCQASVVSGNSEIENDQLYKGNVLFTEQVVNKFSMSRFVYISTVSVHSQIRDTITEKSIVSPSNEYSISKLWAEKIVLQNHDSVIIRFPSLYGIRMKENTLIPNYINQALKNGEIEVFGKGIRRQNYLNISDAISIIRKAIRLDKFNKEIFLGTYVKEFSNIEIANLIKEETGAKITHVGEDNSPSVKYDNRFTRKRLNWEPIIRMSDGLIEYIKWKKEPLL
jgi:nucleoside-diphosphate-sugar epimerase